YNLTYNLTLKRSPTVFSTLNANATNLFIVDFFFQAEDGIRDPLVTGVQTCALPIFPLKTTGAHIYMQNFRLPGMLHGRAVRPSAVGAKLASVDESSVKDIPGLVKVVVKGNFVGVVCQREEQAIRAARDLKLTWQDPIAL